MAIFLIHEIQRVRAIREVEASDADEAYRLFCNGEGVPVGRDGDVISSDLVSNAEVERT